MNGFGVKYFFTLSSRKRSGSNSSAGERYMVRLIMRFEIVIIHTIRAPEVCSTMYEERTVKSSEIGF